MADLVTTTTTTTNDNDDWEVAVDTGEFDKRHEQQEKARAANQEPVITPIVSTINDDENRNSPSINLMNSNKPIRILRRPTNQSQTSTNNDTNKISSTNSTVTSSAWNNTNTTTNSNSISSVTTSSTTVPVVSIIPRIQNKDSTNNSQSNNTSSSSQPNKPPIKTYEQRELEYRLARLRIMGEEESSAKDDDDFPTTTTNTTIESTTISTDDSTKLPPQPSSTTTRTNNKAGGMSHQPLQCHSTPGSYASNLYTLNNASGNPGAIHFSPNNNSTPNLGPGLFPTPNMPPNYRGAYSVPYSHMPPPPRIPSYPYSATTNSALYMTSTPPFVSAPSSSGTSSFHPPSQQHANMSNNNWYNYQHSTTPSGAQQFGHPQ